MFYCIYVPNFFIHSSVDGHLGCFHVLAFVNSAAMNVGVHVSFSVMVFSGHMPSSGIPMICSTYFLCIVLGMKFIFCPWICDCSSTIYWKTFPSSLNCFDSAVESQLYAWTSFWSLHSVPLVCVLSFINATLVPRQESCIRVSTYHILLTF